MIPQIHLNNYQRWLKTIRTKPFTELEHITIARFYLGWVMCYHVPSIDQNKLGQWVKETQTFFKLNKIN